MVGYVDNLSNHRRVLRSSPVHFQADLLSEFVGRFGTRQKCPADPFDRPATVLALDESVGADLDATATNVPGEFQETASEVDVLLDHAVVGTVVFAGRPESNQGDRRVGKTGFDLCSLSPIQADLDTVLVSAAEFYAGESGLLAVGDQCWQIPLGSPQVGDHAQLQFGFPVGFHDTILLADESRGGADRSPDCTTERAARLPLAENRRGGFYQRNRDVPQVRPAPKPHIRIVSPRLICPA